jgi:translation initiation factor IF-3
LEAESERIKNNVQEIVKKIQTQLENVGKIEGDVKQSNRNYVFLIVPISHKKSQKEHS